MLLVGFLISSAISVITLPLLLYDHLVVIPDLNDQITKLESLSNELQIERNLLFKRNNPDLNLELWDKLMSIGVYNLYSSNEFYKNVIHINIEEFNKNIENEIISINNEEQRIKNYLKNIFCEKNDYYNYNQKHFETVEFETKLYFSKIKFLMEDIMINNHFCKEVASKTEYIELSSNLEILFNEEQFNLPRSFDTSYQKKFNYPKKYLNNNINKFNF